MKPAWAGYPRYIRRNLQNLVYVFDPGQLAQLESAAYLFRYMAQSLPIRIGLLLRLDWDNDISVEIGRLFMRIKVAQSVSYVMIYSLA
jgi:hypothetical protein